MVFFKRAAAFVMLYIFLTLLTPDACAEADSNLFTENKMESYNALNWEGDPLQYDESSRAVYFAREAGKKEYSASFTLKMKDQPEKLSEGLWFYADGGNGSTNGDSGIITVSGYDDKGEEVFSYSSVPFQYYDNYHRFSLGKEDGYFSISDKVAAVTVTLSATDSDGSDRVDAYFRNLSLLFGAREITDYTVMDTDELVSSGNLQKVEIGDMTLSRWIWIALIIIVCVIFYLIRKKKQKYETGKMLKTKKTYEK